MKVALTEATAEQLRAFALEKYDLKIHHASSVETSIEKLKEAGFDGEEIDIEAPAPHQQVITTQQEETISVVALKGYFPADGSEKMVKYGSKTKEYKVNDEWKIEKIPEPRDLPKSEALPMIKAKVLIRAEDL